MQSQGKENWFRNLFSSKRTSKGQNDQDGRSNRTSNTCVTLIIKPLRIFQFLVVLLIFVFVIYTIALKSSEISTLSCIILIVLSGVYVFVLAVDLISQFSGGELHAIPMFLFSLLGVLLFGAAGILLIMSHSATGFWYILVISILSILITLLFVIDVMMVLAFWKRRCNQCKRCCQTDAPEILHGKSDQCHPLCTETVRHDLMTSVSSLRIPSGDEDAMPDHSYRKVGYGRRRQYVDCPTGARSTSAMDIVGVQTDPRVTFTIESQTRRNEVKEMPVQTVSKCELCHRQIQLNTISTTKIPSTLPQQASQCPCPTFVQLLRGTPCCSGCVAGIVQVQQQTQKEQPPNDDQPQQQKNGKQIQWTEGTDQNAYGMLTSEKSPMGSQRQNEVDPKLTGVPGTITKLTLASYCVKPNKKITTSCQTTSDDDAKAIHRRTSDSTKKQETKVETVEIRKDGEEPRAIESLTPDKQQEPVEEFDLLEKVKETEGPEPIAQPAAVEQSEPIERSALFQKLKEMEMERLRSIEEPVVKSGLFDGSKEMANLEPIEEPQTTEQTESAEHPEPIERSGLFEKLKQMESLQPIAPLGLFETPEQTETLEPSATTETIERARVALPPETEAENDALKDVTGDTLALRPAETLALPPQEELAGIIKQLQERDDTGSNVEAEGKDNLEETAARETDRTVSLDIPEADVEVKKIYGASIEGLRYSYSADREGSKNESDSRVKKVRRKSADGDAKFKDIAVEDTKASTLAKKIMKETARAKGQSKTSGDDNADSETGRTVSWEAEIPDASKEKEKISSGDGVNYNEEIGELLSTPREGKIDIEDSVQSKTGDTDLTSMGEPKKILSTEEKLPMQRVNAFVQAETILSPSSSGAKRTHTFQRKNKVEPVHFTPAEAQTLSTKRHSQTETIGVDKPVTEITSSGDEKVPTKEQSTNICSSCKKQKQHFPTSGSFQYYSVHKDKRGRLYCEFCAAPNFIQAAYKVDRHDARRQRCAGCGNLLRLRSMPDGGSSTRNKSDGCQKCGQPQFRVQTIKRV